MKLLGRDGLVARTLTPPFLVAVVLLGAAVPLARFVDFRQIKKALPLKAPFSTLDAAALHPYEVAERVVLDPMVVEALGTNQYLDWRLRDTRRPAGHPLEWANLLVTYYSGGSTLVPHTPDFCFLGSGYEPFRPHENTEVDVPTLESRWRQLAVRVCTFRKTGLRDWETPTVVYTFFCNGRFTASRNTVRLLTHDPRDTYAFYSKIEVSFPRATREQNVEGAVELLARVLPVLVRDHFPDFEAAKGRRDEAT